MSALQPHQQRVVEEKTALDEKIGRLHAFMTGPVFPTLHQYEQKLLDEQRHHMIIYSAVLAQRISFFS
jgi:hypothetical protein